MHISLKTIFYLLPFLLVACNSEPTKEAETTSPPKTETVAKGSLPLDKLRLPEGYTIKVYAEDVENARQMAFDERSQTLFVGTRKVGSVYALQDLDKDGVAEKKTVLASGLNMPNGVALKDGNLYVAEVNRVLVFKDINAQIKENASFEVVYDQYPTETHHGWKYIDFGPDGDLYIPVGAPCNICDTSAIFSTITKLDLESKKVDIVQRGVRNTVGFTWHPENNDLWFTDNGRDWMGDNSPDCELNHATKTDMHFGFPYCHAGNLLDSVYGVGKNCADYIPPVAKLGPHVAPLGLAFYTGNQFPDTMRNQILIAEHGSWNRSTKIGYRIKRFNVETNKQEVFIDGWLNDETQEVWGRPVDIEPMPDGSVLISDDYGHAIYQVSFESG